MIPSSLTSGTSIEEGSIEREGVRERLIAMGLPIDLSSQLNRSNDVAPVVAVHLLRPLQLQQKVKE